MIPPHATNLGTQPTTPHPVFLRPDVVVRGWYFVAQSAVLRPGTIRSVAVGRHRIVVFRGRSGIVGALDAWCPHMGTDLAIGEVIGDRLRCRFHHASWAADGAGPHGLRANAWPVVERYGAVWVFSDHTPDVALLDVPGVPPDADLAVAFDPPNPSRSHPHTSMINGLDVHHLDAVHGVRMDLTVDVTDDGPHLDVSLDGDTPATTLPERAVAALVGRRYGYAMRYQRGTVAALVTLRHARLPAPLRGRWPELFTLFAYRTEPDGSGFTQPIFLTPRAAGRRGALAAQARLRLTQAGYRALRDADQQIYDHLRFDDTHLLPVDAPVARFIRWIDRQPVSCWSVP